MPSAKRHSRVTLKDVGRLAGVHPATVSRALNEDASHLVNTETQEAVRRAAEQLGYQINPIARSLRTSRSYSVGILIPDIKNPLFPPMVRGIQDTIEPQGYTSLIANTEEDVAREETYLDAMLSRQVDGVISATATATGGDVALARVVAAGASLVLANRRSENGEESSVTVDDAAGIALASRYLADLGHRRIAHIAGPLRISTGIARYEGFRRAMEEIGLPCDDDQIAFANFFSEAEGQRCMEQLLRSPQRPTAVIAANDLIALGIYDALQAAGLRCPEDISVVGFNDMPFVDRFHPPLTTVRVPSYKIGQLSGELLLEGMVAGTSTSPRHIVLRTELVVRASAAPVRDTLAAPARRTPGEGGHTRVE